MVLEIEGRVHWKDKSATENVLLQRESFAFIYIEVDELILWLEVTLHLSWISPWAYCCLPDSSFLYNYKIMRLFIMSPRFEIRIINGGVQLLSTAIKLITNIANVRAEAF